MEKLLKFLRKLNAKELNAVKTAMVDIKRRNLSRYNVKKLSGFTDVYRVRVQSIRIIFQEIDGETRILDVSRRNEKTYKKY